MRYWDVASPSTEFIVCPCCGYPTLTDRDAYEICCLCNWEDDGQNVLAAVENAVRVIKPIFSPGEPICSRQVSANIPPRRRIPGLRYLRGKWRGRRIPRSAPPYGA